jgi:hypothetical protein
VDFNKLIARVKGILLTPKTEWPVIAGESTTVADLYKGYIVWLAAIPPIFTFCCSRVSCLASRCRGSSCSTC